MSSGPRWVMSSLPSVTVPRGPIEYPPSAGQLPAAGEMRVDQDGDVWMWSGSEWMLNPPKRLAESFEQALRWRVLGREVTVTEIGDDGLPPEHVEIDGVDYERVWSVTAADWVYAA